MIPKTHLTILAFIVSCSLFSVGQETLYFPKLSIEGLTAFGTDSKRFFRYNTNSDIYFEGRIGYRFNRFFEGNFFAGYQHKSYLYFAEKNGNETLLFMDRRYVPIGINARLYISDFFSEKLRLWKDQNRWDIYLQFGIGLMKGHDKNDDRENALRNQGYTVPFYKHPYVIDYNRFYVLYLAGIKFHLTKNINLFIEGGQGALMSGQIGVSGRFFKQITVKRSKK